MAEETVRVDPEEDSDSLIARLKQARSKDVVLALPNKTRALQTLDNFYALRKSARDDGLNLTFSGGNKTMKGLAKLLGFQIEGGDGSDDSDIAEFVGPGTSTEQLNGATSRPSPAFDGPPAGFAIAQPPAINPPRNGNGAGRGEATSAPRPQTPDDFFNSINVPDMTIPSINPPPMPSGNGNGFENDQVLDRNSAVNFFGDLNIPGTSPLQTTRPAPPPETPSGFEGGGSGEGKTMTYEQAMQSGLFGGANANLSQDFKFDAPIEPPLIDEDMVVPPPPTGDDTAADRFRGRSGRREVDDNAPTRGGKKGKASVAKPKPSRQGGPGRIAVPAGLAALGARVNKVLNPVEKTTGGGMMRVEISPEERARRQKQSQRTTFIVFAVIALVIVGVVAAIVLSLRGNSVDNPAVNPVGTTRLNLTYKTNPVSNTVTVLLDPNSTPGTNSTTNPTTQGTGAATGGRLAVSQVSATAVTAKGEYPAFGKKSEPSGTAQGNVTFINASNQPTGYAAGTVLFTNRANGVTYRLREAVSVPAGNVFAGTQGRGNGVVVADRAGSVGNYSNGFSFTLGVAVGVTSGPIGGGSEQQVKAVSPQDIEAFTKQLVEQAQAEAQTGLKGKYDPNIQDIQILSTGQPSCQFNKNAGDVADSFSGSCTVTPQAYIYNKADLLRAAQEQLVVDPKLRLEPGSVKATGPAQLKNENNRLTLQLPVSGTSYGPIDTDKLKQSIANKLVAEAQTIMTTEYPQIERLDMGGVKDGKLPEASKLEIVVTPGAGTIAPSSVSSATPTARVVVSPTAKP